MQHFVGSDKPALADIIERTLAGNCFHAPEELRTAQLEHRAQILDAQVRVGQVFVHHLPQPLGERLVAAAELDSLLYVLQLRKDLVADLGLQPALGKEDIGECYQEERARDNHTEPEDLVIHPQLLPAALCLRLDNMESLQVAHDSLILLEHRIGGFFVDHRGLQHRVAHKRFAVEYMRRRLYHQIASRGIGGGALYLTVHNSLQTRSDTVHAHNRNSRCRLDPAIGFRLPAIPDGLCGTDGHQVVVRHYGIRQRMGTQIVRDHFLCIVLIPTAHHGVDNNGR